MVKRKTRGEIDVVVAFIIMLVLGFIFGILFITIASILALLIAPINPMAAILILLIAGTFGVGIGSYLGFRVVYQRGKKRGGIMR